PWGGCAGLLGQGGGELAALPGDAESRPPGPNGPASFAEFAARLAGERERGWAYADEEFEPGLVGVAAPVFDFDGRVVAALNLSGPKFRAEKALATAGPRLTEDAAGLSSLLGQPGQAREAEG